MFPTGGEKINMKLIVGYFLTTPSFSPLSTDKVCYAPPEGGGGMIMFLILVFKPPGTLKTPQHVRKVKQQRSNMYTDNCS